MIAAASRRRSEQQRAARGARGHARRLWRGVDAGAVVPTWRQILPQLVALLSGVQVAAAQSADAYVAEALAAQGIDRPVEGAVDSAGLSGVASDGWPLASLLAVPAVRVMDLVRDGMPVPRAMAAGLASLEMIAATQAADAFRVADSVASTARRVQLYARVLGPRPCSRCIILAGQVSSWQTAYRRHPNCSCSTVPTDRQHRDDVRAYPRDYFDALRESEQDEIFTRAGAQAIRDGADMARVVNARRRAAGMRPASDYARTRRRRSRRGTEWAELTAAEGAVPGRGRMQRRTTLAGDHFVTFEDPLVLPGGGVAPRLMPESIYEIARDQEHAIDLLRRHGYLRDVDGRLAQLEAAREASRERARTGQPGFG